MELILRAAVSALLVVLLARLAAWAAWRVLPDYWRTVFNRNAATG